MAPIRIWSFPVGGIRRLSHRNGWGHAWHCPSVAPWWLFRFLLHLSSITRLSKCKEAPSSERRVYSDSLKYSKCTQSWNSWCSCMKPSEEWQGSLSNGSMKGSRVSVASDLLLVLQLNLCLSSAVKQDRAVPKICVQLVLDCICAWTIVKLPLFTWAHEVN